MSQFRSPTEIKGISTEIAEMKDLKQQKEFQSPTEIKSISTA